MGNKEVDNKETLNIELPAGIDKDQAIKIDLEENTYIFSVMLEEHPLYKRDGNDLIYEIDISLCDALCSVEFPLQLLDGQNIIIKTPDNMVIKPYTIHVLHGLGLPVLGKKQFGDLKIISK